MEKSLIYDTNEWLLISLLLILMSIAYFIGRILGQYRIKSQTENKIEGSNTILAALFALLGLLLAFTFHLAGSRHDTRRQYVIDEANNIRTAILRADMYDDHTRADFRKDFKTYLELRIAYFNVGADWDKIDAMTDSTHIVFNILWNRASVLSKDAKYDIATRQMIPALNDMIDITVTRRYATLARVPDAIVWMLFILAVINAFFTGYVEFGNKNKDWFVVIGFCTITVLVIHNILDLDRPRRGEITLKSSNKALEDLRLLLK